MQSEEREKENTNANVFDQNTKNENRCEILVQIENEKANQNKNYVHEDGNLSANSTKKEERAIAKTNRKRVKKVST